MNFHFFSVTATVLILFGATIFVHELGHYLAARLLGLVVDTFSLGFGPAVWKFKRRGTVYKIGLLPLGGYVALPQMDPAPDRAGPDAVRQPPPAPPWKKIVVSAAGAAGNLALAAGIAWIVFWAGKPSTPGERSAVIGYAEPASAAYAAGLRTGDEILSVGGAPVSNWQEVLQESARRTTAAFTLRTPTGIRSIRVPTEETALGFRAVPGLSAVSLCRVMGVEPGSAADQAGLRPGDLVRAVDFIPVLSIEHLIDLIAARPETETRLTLQRGDRTLELALIPRLDAALGRARIGIRFDPTAVDYDRLVHIPPHLQLRQHAGMILRVLRSLLSRDARRTAEGLGGPPMILYMIQDTVRKGLRTALWFLCFLNVNLAILNLLPIPVLDGGHILFSLVELAAGRPLPARLNARIHQVFFALFMAAILWLSARDLIRLNTLRQLVRAAAEPATNSAPPAAGRPEPEPPPGGEEPAAPHKAEAGEEPEADRPAEPSEHP